MQTAANKGYDPLKEDFDGRLLQVAPGYERAKCGPTTNFVGNHMTQVGISHLQKTRFSSFIQYVINQISFSAFIEREACATGSH